MRRVLIALGCLLIAGCGGGEDPGSKLETPDDGARSTDTDDGLRSTDTVHGSRDTVHDHELDPGSTTNDHDHDHDQESAEEPLPIGPTEGFFPPDALTPSLMTDRHTGVDADTVRRVSYRVAKLVIHDGVREAPAAELEARHALYCQDVAARTWNADYCRAIEDRDCQGGTCRYEHFGNCSGPLIGGGVMLTAAHCVAGLLDEDERRERSVILQPGPFGTPDRLPLGEITVGKSDFEHHWVAIGERTPVDVAAIAIGDGELGAGGGAADGAPPMERAPLPDDGAPLFIVGYPRVERRSEADRRAHGYTRIHGTPAASFGRLADGNAAGLPLCSVDGRQEHWQLADDCPAGEVTVDGEPAWTGVITRSPALATFDTCNGYSGAPVFDAEGRLVGLSVTLTGPVDPQQRHHPDTRAVFIPIEAARERLKLK